MPETSLTRKRQRHRGRECPETGSDPSVADAAACERKCYRAPFRYNPLHDLESLWWNAAYFLMSRTLVFDEEDGSDSEYDLEAEEEDRRGQLASLRTLFIDWGGRSWAMQMEGGFYHELDSLHPFMQIGRAHV